MRQLAGGGYAQHKAIHLSAQVKVLASNVIRKSLVLIRDRPEWGGPGRIPSRYKDTGPCPEPLPMYGHRFVPVAACFIPQYHAQLTVDYCRIRQIQFSDCQPSVPGLTPCRCCAAGGLQVTSLQSDRADSGEKPPHLRYSARCVRSGESVDPDFSPTLLQYALLIKYQSQKL